MRAYNAYLLPKRHFHKTSKVNGKRREKSNKSVEQKNAKQHAVLASQVTVYRIKHNKSIQIQNNRNIRAHSWHLCVPLNAKKVVNVHRCAVKNFSRFFPYSTQEESLTESNRVVCRLCRLFSNRPSKLWLPLRSCRCQERLDEWS